MNHSWWIKPEQFCSADFNFLADCPFNRVYDKGVSKRTLLLLSFCLSGAVIVYVTLPGKLSVPLSWSQINMLGSRGLFRHAVFVVEG